MPPLPTDTASCLAQRGSWDGRVGGEIKKEKAHTGVLRASLS